MISEKNIFIWILKDDREALFQMVPFSKNCRNDLPPSGVRQVPNLQNFKLAAMSVITCRTLTTSPDCDLPAQHLTLVAANLGYGEI